MKRFRTYFFASGLMLGSLLLQYDPASADTMAHFGRNSECQHMLNPTSLVPAPPAQTFRLCRGTSGATSWAAIIVKNAVPPQPPMTVCTRSTVNVPPNGMTEFTCNISGPGTYKGTVTYYVGGYPFTHLDYTWKIP